MSKIKLQVIVEYTRKIEEMEVEFPVYTLRHSQSNNWESWEWKCLDKSGVSHQLKKTKSQFSKVNWELTSYDWGLSNLSIQSLGMDEEHPTKPCTATEFNAALEEFMRALIGVSQVSGPKE